MKPKDVVLAPIYLLQAVKLKHSSPSLPEPKGERHGVIQLSHNQHNHSETAPKDSSKPLSILMVGDSSAAGVGVDHQEDALLGHLLNKLKTNTRILQSYSQINWEIHATTGHTSFDILRRLYVLPTPKQPIDVAIVMVGVNDTTANVNKTTWQSQLQQIIKLLKRKFLAQYIIFPSLPPMAHMPAIPRPLSTFIGAKADERTEDMVEVCATFDNVSTLSVDFSNMGMTSKQLFSADGFHPNSIAYEYWSRHLANLIIDNVCK